MLDRLGSPDVRYSFDGPTQSGNEFLKQLPHIGIKPLIMDLSASCSERLQYRAIWQVVTIHEVGVESSADLFWMVKQIVPDVPNALGIELLELGYWRNRQAK